MYPHLVTVLGNASGTDYIGTDPHGSLEVLQKVVDLLKPEDRLFLCGDLIDRGESSFATLKYLSDMQEEGKNILLIRGNHEDLLLKILDVVELEHFLKKLSDTKKDFQKIARENWQEFLEINTHSDYSCLEALNLKQINNLLMGFEAYMNVGFEKPAVMDECVIKELIGDEKGLPLSKNVVDCIMNLFNRINYHVKNRGEWVFKLNPEQLIWVKNFITPLPYMIRVGAVRQGDRMIASFDIVHAAPLRESDIRVLLDRTIPIMDDNQIHYLTWARPQERCGNGDEEIFSVGRSSCSTRTYVGHNIFSANYYIYEQINVFVLDVSTPFTYAMLIANHTDNKILKIQLEADKQNASEKDLMQLELALDTLQNFAEVSPSCSFIPPQTLQSCSAVLFLPACCEDEKMFLSSQKGLSSMKLEY